MRFDKYTTTSEETVDYIIAAWDNDEYCYNIVQAICQCSDFAEQNKMFASNYKKLKDCVTNSFSWLEVDEQAMVDAIDEYILRDKEEKNIF